LIFVAPKTIAKLLHDFRVQTQDPRDVLGNMPTVKIHYLNVDSVISGRSPSKAFARSSLAAFEPG
jgi:hypothetical protein